MEVCTHGRSKRHYCLWCDLEQDVMLTGRAIVKRDGDGNLERIAPERFYLPPKETEE